MLPVKFMPVARLFCTDPDSKNWGSGKLCVFWELVHPLHAENNNVHAVYPADLILPV